MSQSETAMSLQGDKEIVITRQFDAPPGIVFKAWTDPELVKLWWAPQALGVSMVRCEADVRVGGLYRYVLANPDGEIVAFSGEYHEIEPARCLVYTQVLEQMTDAGHALIEVTFSAVGEQTSVRSLETYPSAQVRHIAVTSGMEEGMRQTMDQLATLVSSLAS